MFAASDMTSRCDTQSSQLVPSRTARHLASSEQQRQPTHCYYDDYYYYYYLYYY